MSDTQATANPQTETDLDYSGVIEGLEKAAVEAGYSSEEGLIKAGEEKDKGEKSEEEFEKEMDAMKKKYPEMMKKYMSKKDSTVTKAGEEISSISSAIESNIEEAESAMSAMNSGVDIKGIFEPFNNIAKAVEEVAKASGESSANFEDRLSSVEDKLEKAVDVVNKMIPGIALLVKKHVESEKTVSKASDESISKAEGETAPADARGIVGAVEGEEVVNTPEARFAKAVDELVASHGALNAVNDFFAKANSEFAKSKDSTVGEIATLVSGLNHFEYDKLKKLPPRLMHKAEELIKAL